MAENGTLEGSIDEAAVAIQALMERGPVAPEVSADEGDEDAATAAQIEAISAQPLAAEPEEIPSEEAPEGETPAEPAPVAEPVPPPVQAKAPPPVIAPAPQVAAAPGTQAPITAQEQLTQLNQLVPVLQGQLAAAFPEVRTSDDLMKMAVEDPARYIIFKAHQDRIQQAQGLQAQAQAAYRNEWVASETSKLQSLIPEIADPEKGPALQQKLTAYAKEHGYTDQQIMWAGAADVKMLHDAMQFRDQAVAAKAAADAKAKADAEALKKAQAKAAEAPPVQKPGAARPANSKDEKLKELTERAEKTGRIEDIAALIAFRGGQV